MSRKPRLPDLLIVCRANRARSPLTAAILRWYAVEHEVRPRPFIATSGLFAEPGAPLLPSVEEVLRGRGMEPSTHSARPFQRDEARAADLVITFERTMLRAILEDDLDLLPRCFTLREVLRLVRSPHFERGRTVAETAGRMHRLRPLVAGGEEDDTPDPVGAKGAARQRKLLETLAADAAEAAPLLLGSGQASSVVP